MAVDRRRRSQWTVRDCFVCRTIGPFALLLILTQPVLSQSDETSQGPDTPNLSLIDRSISLVRPEQGEQGDHRRRWLTWRIEYRLRNAQPTPLRFDPETLFCTVEGWASNSRAEGHGLPRRADHAIRGGELFQSRVCLIDHEDPTLACSERATLQLWADAQGTPEAPASGTPTEPSTEGILVEPGAVLRVRLLLEHSHHLYGLSEPLLGTRELNLRVGPAAFRDRLDLDRPLAPDREMDRLSPIPEERRDPRVYFSPPDSLYLDAALSGFRSFQFRDLKVPRDAPMRLSFRYFRSSDSTGKVRMELKQYKDVPNSYQVLTQAKRVEELPELGEWVLVEHRFHSDPLATTMQLRFLIDCEGDGPSAVWIDDVVLEPIDLAAN
ncbi:hypothetical protein [Tautonia marina]|uniref:hypothetical protein n=1 Tax=Tautonia marina TaxID=2653855 RepID=UPI0012611234|nr:hypothetical protein [Tautonia marina]